MQLLNIRKYGFFIVLLMSTAFLIISCGDDDDPDTCETTGLTYDNFAKDFLVSNCATAGGCHVAANANDLTVGSYETYEEAKIVVNRGKIKAAINHEDGVSNMPKGEPKLSDCNIAKLSAWIDAGAPE